MRCRAVVVILALAFLASSPTASHAADGDFDPSFGVGGGVSPPFTGVSAGGGGLVLQSDGAVVAAIIKNSSLQVARYDTTGTLDTGFGTGGVLTTTAPGFYLNEMILQPDGKILLLAGNAIARYDVDWNPDPTFGSGGVVVLPDCGLEFYEIADLLLLADGSMLVAMPTNDPNSCVMRFTPDGSPVATFGVSGVVQLPDFYTGTLAAQGDKVLVGGATALGGVPTPALLRLLVDGTIDPGFGTGGVFSYPLATTTIITATTTRGDGGLLALTDGGEVLAVSANGKLDPTFGTDGVAEAGIEDGGFAVLRARSIAVGADGRIIVGATRTDFSSHLVLSGVLLTRHESDGTLDTSFDGDGVHGSLGGDLGGLLLQPDGKIVVVAAANPFFPGEEGNFGIARHIGYTLICPPSAALSCHAGVVPGAGKLRLDDPLTNAKAKFQWQWRKGAATALGEFGDPVGGDDYTICLYDESGGSVLASGAVIPGGGLCKGKPCWKALGTSGFAYADSNRQRFGIAAIKLKAGVAGKARISIKGQGSTLPVSPLPAALPLRMQLFAGNGQCWESVFSMAGTSRNDGTRYQGVSD